MTTGTKTNNLKKNNTVGIFNLPTTKIKTMRMNYYVLLLTVGIILLFATQSEFYISNIIGLAMTYLACHKLNLFYEND